MGSSPRLRKAVAGGFAALVVGAGALGYLIGQSHNDSAFTVGPGLVYAGRLDGTAYIGADEPLNGQPTGFAYEFPPGVPWIDTNGVEHDGDSRPACVPYYHAVRVRQMKVVKFSIGQSGGYEGTVVWVRC